MKATFNKINEFRREKGETFRLGSAIAVGILLLAFIGATLYVLFSSYASA